MTAPTLFDQLEPRARRSDPVTSHEAAAKVAPGRSELVEAIRWTLHGCEPATAFEIAAAVERSHPGRWDEGTVRTAIKRADLVAVDDLGISPRGIRCLRFVLGGAR